MTEAIEKAKRRAFTVEYKRRIVKEAEACNPAMGLAKLAHCFGVRGCTRPN